MQHHPSWVGRSRHAQMEKPGSARVTHTHAQGIPDTWGNRGQVAPGCCGASNEGIANTKPQAGWSNAVMGNGTRGFTFPQRKPFARKKSKQTPSHLLTHLNQSQSSTETRPTAFPQSRSLRAGTWVSAGVFNITGRRSRGSNNTESVAVTPSQLLRGVSST